MANTWKNLEKLRKMLRRVTRCDLFSLGYVLFAWEEHMQLLKTFGGSGGVFLRWFRLNMLYFMFRFMFELYLILSNTPISISMFKYFC